MRDGEKLRPARTRALVPAGTEAALEGQQGRTAVQSKLPSKLHEWGSSCFPFECLVCSLRFDRISAPACDLCASLPETDPEEAPSKAPFDCRPGPQWSALDRKENPLP